MNVPFESRVPFEWLARFAEIYGEPGVMSEQAAALYFRAVGCTDAQRLIDAMGRWLRTEPRFPRPSDLRKVLGIVDVSGATGSSAEPSAAEGQMSREAA